MHRTIACGAIAGLVAAASGADVTFTRIAAIDFSGQITGNQIGSVAWDGSTAYVGTYAFGGRDASGAGFGGPTGITAADNALTGPTFRTFGERTTADQQGGYMGLAIKDGLLASSWATKGFSGGTVTDDAISVWNAGSGALITNGNSAANANGWAGPAFDPVNGGVAFASFGSGRFRQISTDGTTNIWDNASGPFNFDGAWGTAYRDIDTDSAGNIYAREGAQVVKFTRNAPNGFEIMDGRPGSIINGETNADLGDNVQGNNLTVIEDFGIALWNNRFDFFGNVFTPDQWENQLVVGSALDGSGPVTIDFAGDPSFFVNNGWLDFSYDSATKTLAVSEWSSNRVYIYAVTPAPAAAAAFGFGGVLAARRRR